MPAIRFRRRWPFAASALVSVLLAACAAAPPHEAGESAARIERFDREIEFGKDVARVEVINPYGEINVRNYDEPGLGLHAVVQRLPPTFAALDVHRSRHGDTLRIEVGYPRGVAADAPGRMDLAVYVRPDMPLALRTRADRIAVKPRIGPLQAESQSGAILAIGSGALVLRTESGYIRAVQTEGRWSGDTRIDTDSGAIVALVPTFGNLRLDAQTGGVLSVGYGLSIHEAADGTHTAQARYGNGESLMQIRSRSGKVTLDQLVLANDGKLPPVDDD